MHAERSSFRSPHSCLGTIAGFWGETGQSIPREARVINPAAARAINPDAARVLNPERAKVLTPDQARTITVEQAREPVQAK